MDQGRLRPFGPLVGQSRSVFAGLKIRNISPDQALLSTGGVVALQALGRHLWNEVPMATRQHQQIVETPTEARQAEPGPSVLALLTVSTGLAVLILGILWFAFFRI